MIIAYGGGLNPPTFIMNVIKTGNKSAAGAAPTAPAVIVKASSNKTQIDWKEIDKKMSSKFIYYKELLEVVRLAYESNTNAILFGPGGHGKSEMADFILKEMFGKDNVSAALAMNQELNPSDLFGGIDLKAFHDDRLLNVAFDNSIFAKKGARIEEMFDGRADTLLSLKEFLTSGVYCYGGNGAVCYPSVSELVLGCTNVTPNEFLESSDNARSANALMERFIMQTNVVWPDYSSSSFYEMLIRVKPDENKDTLMKYSAICEALAARITFSPRTAVKFYGAFQANPQVGLKSLMGMSEQDLQHMLNFLPKAAKVGNTAVLVNKFYANAEKLQDLYITASTVTDYMSVNAVAVQLYTDAAKIELHYETQEEICVKHRKTISGLQDLQRMSLEKVHKNVFLTEEFHNLRNV